MRLLSETRCIFRGFRPGYLARYETGLRNCPEISPQLVYCSITYYGFGQTGSYRRQTGPAGLNM